tara:strand:+ start:40 stop:843 length:804 start_codon:yes stop_codon:yes gene_type:complete
MEVIVGLIIVALIIYFLFIGRSKKMKNTKLSSIPKKEQILNANSGWMEERWALARNERDAGELKSIPIWFFDNATERQLQKIEEIGLKISVGQATKGEASDLIGLFEAVEEENKEILKFFRVSLKNMNQSKARYEVSKLFRDPEKLENWRNRPASQLQKEFYKFFELKFPHGLTLEGASKDIDKYRKELTKENKAKIDEWNAYENIYDEINDPDFLEDYDLKKINLSLYRSVIDQLQNEGKTLTELSDDIDIVIDKVIEVKPDIQKT